MTPREKILREGLETIANNPDTRGQWTLEEIARETNAKADAAPKDESRYLGFAHAEGFISWAPNTQAYSGPLWSGPALRGGWIEIGEVALSEPGPMLKLIPFDGMHLKNHQKIYVLPEPPK